MAEVSLLYFEDCPNWRVVDERLKSLQTELGFTLEYGLVETAQEAVRIGFAGSPTVLVDGTDPFATGDEPTGLACRVYADGSAGMPTLAQLRAAIG